ncbi:MAG TPA: YhjD/YihY/BrkB family envelope integrity protein [Nakamurella sp.]
MAGFAERLEVTALGRLWSRLLELQFVDRSVALAAKAFVSFFPLLILVAAVTPGSVRQEMLEIITNRLGVSGDALETVRQAFASADQTRAATELVGALVTVAFAVSFTTALQRVYLRAWRRPPGGGVRNKGRGAVWVGGFVALMIVLSLVRNLVPGASGPVLSWAVGLIGATGLWWWTARLMLRGEVRWRALLPTAVITGVGGWVYALAASVWMPANVRNQFAEFGAFGIAMAIVTWFTGLAFLIVGAAAAGPALADGEGRVARWLRADQPTAVEPGAVPALPGPVRPVRLSDAFGRGARGSGVVPGADG